MPVWDAEVHYRFITNNGDPSTLNVQIKQDDGSVISITSWDAETSAEDFYHSLVHAVRESGHDLGTGFNLPTKSGEESSKILIEVTNLRFEDLTGNRGTLRKNIERRKGWYYIEHNVITAEDLHYCISVDRLTKMDWEDHLRDKAGRQHLK